MPIFVVILVIHITMITFIWLSFIPFFSVFFLFFMLYHFFTFHRFNLGTNCSLLCMFLSYSFFLAPTVSHSLPLSSVSLGFFCLAFSNYCSRRSISLLIFIYSGIRLSRPTNPLFLAGGHRGLHFLKSVINEPKNVYPVLKTKCTGYEKRISTSE